MQFQIPEQAAVVDLRKGDRWDGAKINSVSIRRCAFLVDRGIGNGSYVAIVHGGTPSFFADLFAVWRSGACAICLNPSLTPAEREHVLTFVRPDLVLIDSENPPPETPSYASFDLRREKTPQERGIQIDRTDTTGESDALILFTSGTTGEPKGVVHSFSSIARRIALNNRYIEKQSLARSLCVLPTHFGHGLIGNCLTPLSAGGNLFLLPGTGLETAAHLADVLITERITFMSSVPSLWKLVSRIGKSPNAATLRRVHVGSAPLTEQLWRRIADWSGCPAVVNMYGITETANWIAGASATETEPEDGLVGRMWGGEVQIRDESGNPVDGIGNIWVRCPTIMTGYFKRPDFTRQALQNGWLRTGDVGWLGDDGRIRLQGRRANEINRAGIKVSAEEIDALIEGHPGILEACAFGIPDQISGELLAVAVVPVAGDSPDRNTLRNWCKPRIRKEGIPERWFFVSEIPKTDRGKVNRDFVRQYCLNPSEA